MVEVAKKTKRESWLGRKNRVRKKARGDQEKPRLAVYRSGKHIYAQIIDDIAGTTVTAASSREKEFLSSAGDSKGSDKDGAGKVGTLLGERAKAKGVERVVFDRNGFLYHGRVKALADAVREEGVKF
ncbi:MAG: 50S ribosomal protein L18 [Nitrospinae bacterium]|nr:50S ribosomal protein L18 [Nitrospinota bacterium]|tara:strand:- start:3046 stop:3426 length:381 start_codon:yes stop_codon:yes gene_type:complete